MSNLKNEILKLRSLGYSYSKIQKELNCAKSTIAYHLSDDVKQKQRLRFSLTIKERKEFINRYKKLVGCKDCGINNPIVLDLDHVRGKKSFELSAMRKYGISMKIIKEEMRKCEVRCANCHRIATYNRKIIT